MKKPTFKLGAMKNMLTREEMKSISGGYTVCCCVGGTYGYLECNHSWSGFPGQGQSCSTYCSGYGASGAQWDSSSLCNHWVSPPCGGV